MLCARISLLKSPESAFAITIFVTKGKKKGRRNLEALRGIFYWASVSIISSTSTFYSTLRCFDGPIQSTVQGTPAELSLRCFFRVVFPFGKEEPRGDKARTDEHSCERMRELGGEPKLDKEWSRRRKRRNAARYNSTPDKCRCARESNKCRVGRLLLTMSGKSGRFSAGIHEQVGV